MAPCLLSTGSVFDFETQVRRAVTLLEGWSGDLVQIEHAAELYEAIVAAMPSALASLGRLPRSEGVALWARLNAAGAALGAVLLGLSIPPEQRAAVRRAVQRVTRANRALVRATAEQARVARARAASPARADR